MEYTEATMWTKYPNVTRIEIIDYTGRAYVRYKVKSLEFSEQDNGQTLKIFVRSDDEQDIRTAPRG
jgi:putative heme iron utilization protein